MEKIQNKGYTKIMKKLKITNIKKSKTQNVFDISIKDEPNYVLENGVITHNSGLKYAASTIVFLSKKKEKDANGEVIGNIIHCKLYKGRFTKENKMVDVRLNYDTGLDKYYGLVDLGLAHGIFVKNSTRITMPDGSNVFEKHIYENPEKYFTKEIMQKLDDAAAKEFKYGSDNR